MKWSSRWDRDLPAHLKRHLGPMVGGWTIRGDPAVSGATFPGTPCAAATTFVSVGLSHHVLARRGSHMRQRF